MEPQRFELTIHNPVQDQGQACGFPVLWDIRLTVEGTNFFNSDGILVRQQAQIREDNTITNLDAGLTIREGPDSFMQTVYFNPDGTVRELVATGLAANVQGDEPFKRRRPRRLAAGDERDRLLRRTTSGTRGNRVRQLPDRPERVLRCAELTTADGVGVAAAGAPLERPRV